MTNVNSIINFGGLSKPATVLIEKISDAIGGVFEPWQIRRVAKAEAEADKIRAVAKIKITDLEQRALRRFMYEEARKQDNIEKITGQSLPQLNENAKPNEVDKDWIINFFDKCRLVSDEEMQNIWARILAGEANNPGKFSKRTINFMSSLAKEDALLFTKLCSFNWMFGENQPLIYDTGADIYTKNEINFSTLKHLDAIGLISFEIIAGYLLKDLPQKINAYYINTPYILEFSNEKNNQLEIGHALLTNIGEELASICKPEIVAGFDEYVIKKLNEKGIKVSPDLNLTAKPSPNSGLPIRELK